MYLSNQKYEYISIQIIVYIKCKFVYQVVFFDFSLTVKAAPHECVIRTVQP